MSGHRHPLFFSQGGCDSVSPVALQLQAAVSCGILHLSSGPIVVDLARPGMDYLSLHAPAPSHRTTEARWCKVGRISSEGERGVRLVQNTAIAPEGTRMPAAGVVWKPQSKS